MNKLSKIPEDNKYYIILLIFYSIAHGGILFIHDAIYWDDWTLYKVSPGVILDTFRQAGSMFNLAGHMHNLFLSFGLWFYRVATFFLMFGAGLALDRVIKKIKYFSVEQRFSIVLLFLILPFYSARVALIDMGYTICYFLFFVAWACIDRFRTISLVLFFLSFNTNSLLVFYSLPFIDFYLRSVNYSWSIKSFVQFLFSKFQFFILPFLYFYIKIIFFKPSGLYEGYNEGFNLINLLVSPVIMFFDWLKFDIPLLWVCFVSLFVFKLIKFNFCKYNLDTDQSKKITYLGCVVFGLGAFPYWILGHVPTFNEWTSRHQILLPLGTSIIIVSFLFGLQRELIKLLMSVIVGSCLIINMSYYFEFYCDWNKQKQLINQISIDKKIKNADLIVFDDRTVVDNALNRVYRPYEWNGIMASAFGDEKRMGLDELDYKKYLNGSLFKGYFKEPEKFRAKEYLFKENPIVVKVLITRENPDSYSGKIRKIAGVYDYKVESIILSQ